jgi:hypothetical protein
MAVPSFFSPVFSVGRKYISYPLLCPFERLTKAAALLMISAEEKQHPAVSAIQQKG